MPLKTLDDLFIHFLKDMYYAERQITKALPKMAEAAESDALRNAFEAHLEETRRQIERLEEVFSLCDRAPRSETCEAIQGLVEEGKEIMEEAEDPDARDAGLIASAQAVEHYEIARYGTLVAWAKQLGMERSAQLLQQNLDEEYGADRKLTEIAEGSLNREAA